jgi:hypothetical protein
MQLVQVALALVRLDAAHDLAGLRQADVAHGLGVGFCYARVRGQGAG